MTSHQWIKVSNYPSYDTIYNTEDGQQILILVYPYKCIRCGKNTNACEFKSGGNLFIDDLDLVADCDLCLINNVIES